MSFLCASCCHPASGAQHLDTASGVRVLSSNVVVRTVQVSPKLPPYRFVLTQDRAARITSQDRQHVGRIDIFAGDSAKVLQSIEVDGTDPAWFQRSFRVLDLNFDGYLDFALLYEVGGKWVSERFWQFDPGSGRFITNALTAELQKFMRLDLSLDPRKKQIHVTFYVGPCPGSFETYEVQSGHLVLVKSELHKPTTNAGQCIVEKRKRTKGELKLIEVCEAQHRG